MKSRAYSFTVATPSNVHSKVIDQLESELDQQFGSLYTKVEVSNQIYLALATCPQTDLQGNAPVSIRAIIGDYIKKDLS